MQIWLILSSRNEDVRKSVLPRQPLQCDYFLSLGYRSKQRYKVKINNMQGYGPYQIKKEELSGNISKIPPVQ